MPLELDSTAPGFDAAFTAFLAAQRASDGDVDAVVAAIIAEVRARGDAAVIDFTKRFDRLALTPATMRVPTTDIAAAAKSCPEAALEALRFAQQRIEAYHRKQVPADLDYTDLAGVRLGARWRPL